MTNLIPFLRSAVVGAALGAACLTVSAPCFAETVNLARNENATEQAIAESLLTKIYARAGLSAKVQPLPGVRANAMTLSGEKDGEVARIQAYATKNPTLIKVEPSYYHLTSTAFARSDRGIVISNKDDLKKYIVGYVRGIAHAEAAVDGVPKVQIVDSYEQLYRMLDSGRIEVAIDVGTNGSYVLKHLGLSTIKPVGELARLNLFNILAPSKKSLAPKISSTISELTKSGELATMTKQAEDDFLKSGASN
jgi:polar amino acid transport system substrate-binding protein